MTKSTFAAALVYSSLLCAGTNHAAAKYARTLDFQAAKTGAETTHQHGGLMNPDTVRWSYYLIRRARKERAEGLGALLSRREDLTPLTGFDERPVNHHFQRHAATDVIHRRQVHFLRPVRWWIVTGRIDSEIAYNFAQT